jgi:hypothetical protein
MTLLPCPGAFTAAAGRLTFPYFHLVAWVVVGLGSAQLQETEEPELDPWARDRGLEEDAIFFINLISNRPPPH